MSNWQCWHFTQTDKLGRAVPLPTITSSRRLFYSIRLVRPVPCSTLSAHRMLFSMALHGAMCGVSPFRPASRQHLSISAPSALLCTLVARESHRPYYYYQHNADGTLTCIIPRPPAYTPARPLTWGLPLTPAAPGSLSIFAGPQVLAY